MYQNKALAIQKIANFLELSITDDVLQNVLEASSLTEMKQSASIGLNHLRQGGYGNWRKIFTVCDSEFFDDVSHIIMIFIIQFYCSVVAFI